jgi:hypothetical protein
MRTPSQGLLQQLTHAALLRAGGMSWGEVADKLNRKKGTCKHWPGLYPDLWHRLLDVAAEELLEVARAEAVGRLRRALRDASALPGSRPGQPLSGETFPE